MQPTKQLGKLPVNSTLKALIISTPKVEGLELGIF